MHLGGSSRTACGDVTEFCDKTSTAAPNLACLATPKQNPAGPATVTVTGFIHVFSSGPNANGVSVLPVVLMPLAFYPVSRTIWVAVELVI